MSENSSVTTPAAKKVSGWVKALVGTVAGLVSGAAMMYLSPLIGNVIEPSKPVANFGYEAQGLTVNFHNRSTSGSDGWWDFGDGSPLEPVVPKQEFITHNYTHPGDYTVKLTLRNLVGKESERTVTVRLNSGNAQVVPPKIESLDAIPLSAGLYAPATFRVVSKIKNAQVCVWEVGDDRPLDVMTEAPLDQDKLITFKKPGGYVIKLVAVNGNQHVQKSEIVNVLEPPSGTVTAVLSVIDQGQRVDTESIEYTFSEQFPPTSKDSVHRFSKQVLAKQGYDLAQVRLKLGGERGQRLADQSELPLDTASFSGQGARNLRLQLAADRHSLRLTGELVKDTGLSKRNAPSPCVVVPVVLVQEKKTPASRPAIPVTATLNVPGSTALALPPLPGNWVEPQRQLRLELRDGERILWQESLLPRGATLNFRNRRYTLTAVAEGEQVHVVLTDVPGQPVGAKTE